MKVYTGSFSGLPWVSHGIFCRLGGVSTGRFTSLNCGLGTLDAPGNVEENRNRVARELGLKDGHLVTLRQTHSATVIDVDKPFQGDDRPEGDALVTSVPGIGLGVLGADCVPVLFTALRGPLVAAAHAGWKGALGGVLEATVGRMAARGVPPGEVAAIIGPCIRQKSYEVGGDFPAPFLAQDIMNQKFFVEAPKAGHVLFDLPGYVAHRLSLMGLAHVDDLGHDTYADHRSFFSHRRATQDGEPDEGRQVSVIAVI